MIQRKATRKLYRQPLSSPRRSQRWGPAPTSTLKPTDFSAMKMHPQKHNILWFPDGNVVLATDSLLFRVHKGVLSLYSTVLRDMFDLPLCSSSQAETTASPAGERSENGMIHPDLYDGLPMVWLSGDKGEEVAHLLQAVYQRGYYNCEDDDTPLEVIIALLTLSAKYDVATIRSDVVKQLARNYPTVLEQYEELQTARPMLFGRQRKECQLPLLKATATTSQSEADIQVVLPALYYANSCTSIQNLYGIETLSLPLPVLHKLLIGDRSLTYYVHTQLCTVIDGVSPPEGCPYNAKREDCNTARRQPQTAEMTGLLNCSVLSSIKGEMVLDTFFEKRCDECRTRTNMWFENARTHLWGLIPALFGFESWDAVRAAK